MSKVEVLTLYLFIKNCIYIKCHVILLDNLFPWKELWFNRCNYFVESSNSDRRIKTNLVSY